MFLTCFFFHVDHVAPKLPTSTGFLRTFLLKVGLSHTRLKIEPANLRLVLQKRTFSHCKRSFIKIEGRGYN